MTISLSDNSPRVNYTVNEGATQSTFTVPFEFFDDDDLNVYVDGTKKTLTTHYTTSDDSGDSQAHTSGTTGFVQMTTGNAVTGASGGSSVVITRDIDLDRTTDFPTSGPFDVATLNTELDRMIAIAADIDDAANRALILSDFDTTASLILPDVSTRASKQLGFDSSGNLVAEEGKVSTVTISASGLSAGATPTATATFTGSSGALALALGIPAGATGATGPAGGGLADLSADTTPQLGGDLDVNGKDIVTASNADIELLPDGTGKTVLKGNTNPGTIVFNCESNSHGQTVKAQPHSAGVTNTLTLPPGSDGELVSTVATQQLTNKTIPDDEKLFFGTGNDGFIEYDENGDDRLKIGGTNVEFEKSVIGKTDTDTSNTGSVTLDFATNQNFVLTLTGAVTLANPTTELVGQTGFIVFIQDGTGGRAVSLDTQYKTVGGVNTLTLSSAANAIDIVPYVVSAADTILLGASQLAFS
jgi:hypothetical protein